MASHFYLFITYSKINNRDYISWIIDKKEFQQEILREDYAYSNLENKIDLVFDKTYIIKRLVQIIEFYAPTIITDDISKLRSEFRILQTKDYKHIFDIVKIYDTDGKYLSIKNFSDLITADLINLPKAYNVYISNKSNLNKVILIKALFYNHDNIKVKPKVIPISSPSTSNQNYRPIHYNNKNYNSGSSYRNYNDNYDSGSSYRNYNDNYDYGSSYKNNNYDDDDDDDFWYRYNNYSSSNKSSSKSSTNSTSSSSSSTSSSSSNLYSSSSYNSSKPDKESDNSKESKFFLWSFIKGILEIAWKLITAIFGIIKDIILAILKLIGHIIVWIFENWNGIIFIFYLIVIIIFIINVSNR